MTTLIADSVSEAALHGLTFLWLEITGKCNLECMHCYADSGPQQDLRSQMSMDDWLSIIQDSAKLGCRQAQFIGGEPTLHPDLPRMISFAAALDYGLIEVFTNATALSERLLQCFVDNNVHVATSFYTDDPTVHDSITKHSGSFVRTVNGIERLIAAGIPIRAGVIETNLNGGHASRARRFLQDMGISNIGVDLQRRVGRGAETLHVLDPLAELCGECWNGKLCVTSSGKAYPCVFSRFVDLGGVENGVSSILTSRSLSGFRGGLREYLLEKGNEANRYSSAYECAPETGCSPACNPSSTCSPCGPQFFCVPGSSCSPDTSCGPTSDPRCSPTFTTGTSGS